MQKQLNSKEGLLLLLLQLLVYVCLEVLSTNSTETESIPKRARLAGALDNKHR